MKKLFTNHKNWWSSLTSTFIGSLLGIGITFGISDYIQNKQQKVMERKMMLTTVCDIDKQCKDFDEECKTYASLDSVFLLMLTHYVLDDQEVMFPKDKMETYYGEVSLEELSRSSKMNDIEKEVNEIKAFSNNSDLITIFKDPSTIDAIKNIVSTIEEFKTALKGLDNMKIDILDYDLKYKTYEMPDYEKHFIEYQLKYEGEKRMNKLQLFSMMYQQGIQKLNKKLQTEWPLIKEMLGITDDDIRFATSKVFGDEWADNILNKDSAGVEWKNHWKGIYMSELERIEAKKQSDSIAKIKSK